MLQFLPYSFTGKEASLVGISTCDHRRRKELEEKRVVQATSETMVNHMFTQWIHSYHDLPLMVVNQRANVTRWEMRTKPFVRTLEFLWQEGHNRNISCRTKPFMQFTDESRQRQPVWQTSWAVSKLHRYSNIVNVNSYELKVANSQGKWARDPWSARYVYFESCK